MGSVGGGVSPQKMHPGVKAFLATLKDGRWHEKFPTTELSVYVPLVCLKLKLAEEKTNRIRGSHYLRVRFRITGRGELALRDGEVPNRNDVRVVRSVHKAGGVETLQGTDRHTWNKLIGILNGYDRGYSPGYLGS